MPSHPVPQITARHLIAALSVGTVAVLMVGVQPILLGALVDARQVSLEGVGLVAMAEIIALGLGVLLGDRLLPVAALRPLTVAAALATAALDLLSMRLGGDGAMTAVRAAAGLSEGVLVWGTTAVIVRAAAPARMGGLFFVVQTIAQAAVGLLLAQAVLPRAGWGGGFATLAVLALLPCLLAPLLPAHLGPLVPASVSGFRWSAAMGRPLAVAFFQLATLGAFWAYLDPLGQAAGLDATSVRTLVSGVLLMQVVGGCIATATVLRLPVVPALAVCSAVLALILGTLHTLPAGSMLAFALGCAGFGFVWMFMLPFHLGLAFQADPTGRVAGLVPAAQLLGSALGPLTASLIVHGDDAHHVPLLAAGFAVVAGVLLLLGRGRGRVGGVGVVGRLR